jgi:predicted transcriptional regulator
MFNNNTELEVRDKLTILMLINDLEVPLTNEEITELVLDSGLINYISLQHYLTELCELSMLERIPQDGKQHYLLTENGRVALDFFKVRVPGYIQNKIEKMVKSFKKLLPVETHIHAEYTKHSETDFEIALSITENKVSMMSLKLHVMSYKHAQMICQKWEENATTSYGDILSLLTLE